jgi:hypothetical protein
LTGHGCGQLVAQLDVLADQGPQQLADALHHLVEVEDDRLRDLLAAKGQELARDRGPALHRPEDLLGIGARGVEVGEGPQQQFAVARQHGEEVVEVVGHPARQPAHRLHLPRLQGRLVRRPLRRAGGGRADGVQGLAEGLGNLRSGQGPRQVMACAELHGLYRLANGPGGADQEDRRRPRKGPHLFENLQGARARQLTIEQGHVRGALP